VRVKWDGEYEGKREKGDGGITWEGEGAEARRERGVKRE